VIFFEPLGERCALRIVEELEQRTSANISAGRCHGRISEVAPATMPTSLTTPRLFSCGRDQIFERGLVECFLHEQTRHQCIEQGTLVADDPRGAFVLLVDDLSHLGVDLLPRFSLKLRSTKLAGPSR